MNINFDARQRTPKGPFAQLLTLVGAVLVLTAAFMFSLVFFAVVAIVGSGLWLYFWWKTRALRRQLREQLAAQMDGRDFVSPADGERATASGEVIDGEAVRVVDENRRLDA